MKLAWFTNQRGNLQFGSSEKKDRGGQTVNIPGPTAEETSLAKSNLELSQLQVGQLKQAIADQEAAKSDPLVQQQRQLEEKATSNLLARVTGQAPVLAPEEQARLDEIYANTLRQGQEQLKFAADEAAGQRGMAITDSPIGNEYLRQQGNLISNMGAQKSASALDLGNANAAFTQNLANFTNQLKQQALANRLAIAGQQPASFGLQQNLFGQRLAAAPRSFTGLSSGSQSGYGLGGSDVAGYGQGLYGSKGAGLSSFWS